MLEDSLTEDLSHYAISRMNNVRVWPKGSYGLFKRARSYLKKIVMSDVFDKSMVISVTLNTVLMGMEKYGMTEEEKNFEYNANMIFTWIFIVEMVTKLLAIGVKKYSDEAMNLLDGGIVLLSIVEMSLASQKGAG